MDDNRYYVLSLLAECSGRKTINEGCTLRFLGLDNDKLKSFIVSKLGSPCGLNASYIDSMSTVETVVNIILHHLPSDAVQKLRQSSPAPEPEETGTRAVRNAFYTRDLMSQWGFADNRNDCFVKNIPSDKGLEFRKGFDIDENETLLFARDTSFWCSADQGMVITDMGLHFVDDNDNPNFEFYSWQDISSVTYNNGRFTFFDGDSNLLVGIDWNYLTKEELLPQKSIPLGAYLEKKFSNMAQAAGEAEDPFAALTNEIDQLWDSGKQDEAISSAERIKDDVGANCYLRLLDMYKQKGDLKSAIAICDEGIEKDLFNERGITYLLWEKESIQHHIGDDKHARAVAVEALKIAPNDLMFNDVNIKKDLEQDFANIDRQYTDTFLDLPYQERKILMPVTEYTHLGQNSMSVIQVDKLRKMNLDFPMGHPIPNQLYVGHPLIPGKYIPFDCYELELIEDKVREFCTLAQYLGAVEINIECLNTMSSSGDRKETMNGKGGYGNMLAEVNVSGTRKGHSHLIEELGKAVSLHQKFAPMPMKGLPRNMVWYQNEPSWQRLYTQRTESALLEHEERIETRKSRVAKASELMSVKAEVETLLVDANLKLSKSVEEKFTQQENAILSIHVKFASPEQMANASGNIQYVEATETPKSLPLASAPTDAEQEYLAELKECLAEDGEITNRERKLLDRIRKSLDISEERAKELEEMLSNPTLTPEEQEYFNEYRDLMADGELSERERRLLDRVRKSLGISENRAIEIENIITKK